MKWALGAVLGGILLVGLLVVGWISGIYNGLVTKREAVSSQVGQIQNQLQRRADLVPNLVEVVKGYAAHESETLQAVIEARAKATQVQVNAEDPESLQRFMQAQDQFSSSIARLMVVAEQYPNLKANEQFMNLQVQLEGTENRISVERMRFNEVARTFNTDVQRFPNALIAGAMGFKPFPYFEASAQAQEVPKVQF